MSNPHVGWGFPFRFEDGRTRVVGGDPEGSPTEAEARTAYVEDIYHLFSTPLGFRVMHPHFGLGLAAYLFSPQHSRQSGLMRREVQEQLELWSKRVEVRSVSAELDPQRASITITPDVVAVGLPFGGAFAVTI